MQYIGQTNQQVSKRMNSHRFDFNTNDGQSYAINVALHLNSGSLNDAGPRSGIARVPDS